MAKVSFLDCPHNNVQQFTECCLDCGYNIYTTEEEYLKDLKEKAREKRRKDKSGAVANEIRELEKELGIG